MSTEDVKTAAPAEVPAAAASEASETPKVPVKQLLEEAKRHVALKQFTAAADKYAEALEELRETHDETEPLFAPLFHRYGHALLEHAIATSGALGGGGGGADAPAPARKKPAKAEASGSGSGSNGAGAGAAKADPRFSFGGDGPDSDEEQEEEEGAGGEGNAEEEEEDDLAVAFSVLELARVGYERILAAGEAAQLVTLEEETWGELSIKAQLAEVHNDLGDVGLESENFQQASSDYEACLKLLTPLLHSHSRRLADAYLRLGLALEFHPDTTRQSEAEKYVQGAAHALRSRSTALEARLKALEAGADVAKQQAAAVEVREEKVAAESAGKGKGKAAAVEGPLEKDDVAEMDLDKATKEAKDVKEMTEELEAKLEEYQQAPPGSTSAAQATGSSSSDKQLVQEAINEVLLGASTNAISGSSSSAPSGPVNDLSSMVKKKKKPVEASAAAETNGASESASAGKRKAEDVSEQGSSSASATLEEASSKRARVESVAEGA